MGLRGSSGSTNTLRGTLYAVSRSFIRARISSRSTECPSASTTAATTSSAPSSFTSPTTAASRIPAWPRNASSTSDG